MYNLKTIKNAFREAVRAIKDDYSKGLNLNSDQIEHIFGYGNAYVELHSFEESKENIYSYIHQPDEIKEFYDFWLHKSVKMNLSGGKNKHYKAMEGRAGRKAYQNCLMNEESREILFKAQQEHTEKVIRYHIMIVTFQLYSKYHTTAKYDDVIDYCNKEGKDNYIILRNCFLTQMCKIVSENIEKQKKDARFNGRNDNNAIKTIFKNEGIDPIDKLTIMTLVSLVSINEKADGEECCKSLYRWYNRTYSTSQKEKNYTESSNSIIGKDIIISTWKNWYQEKTKEGSRFSILFSEKGIEPELLPLAGTLPVNVHERSGEDRPLMEMINCTPGHLYLIGEGGIGKTTALDNIMKSAYEPDSQREQPCKQIPMLIELSMASKKDFDRDKDECYYIRNTLFDLLEKEIQKVESLSSLSRREIRNHISDIFKANNPEPEYILLLDGLNEVSRETIGGIHTVASAVLTEIGTIIDEYKNVRVILTSRIAEDNYLKDKSSKVSTLELSGIKTEDVIAYLEENAPNRLDKIRENTALMDILRVPLFLKMYARLGGNDEFLSRGEILHAFFTKKKGLYSERGKAKTIQEKLHMERNVLKSDESIRADMLNYILDFIMPSIAWYMVKNGNRFHISIDEITKICETELKDNSPVSFFGPSGIKCFEEYKDESNARNRQNVQTVAERIKALGKAENSSDWDKIAGTICDCLAMQVGVLYRESPDSIEYKVFHQHIRDYFAALYHINKLRLAVFLHGDKKDDLARQCLAEWTKDAIPNQVLIFIGEALGELHNVPQYDENTGEWRYEVLDPDPENLTRTLVKQGLGIYRNRIGEEFKEDGYAVWNLFQILKLVRKDLSGEDFSDLDLTKCRAYGLVLGHESEHKHISFSGAKLNDEFFMPQGHVGLIRDAQFSPDGTLIVTVAQDNSPIIWSFKTYQRIGALKGHDARINQVSFSRDSQYIVTASGDKAAKIWKREQNSDSFYCVGTLTHLAPVNDAQFSQDGTRIVTATEDGTVKVWKREQESDAFNEVATLSNPYNDIKTTGISLDSAEIVQFSKTEKYIIAFGYACESVILDTKNYKLTIPKLAIWDGKSYDPVNSIDHIISVFRHSQFSSNEIVAFRSRHCLFEVIDAISMRTLGVLSEKDIPIFHLPQSAQNSSQGNYIVTTLGPGMDALIWDANCFKPVKLLEGYSSVHYSEDEKYIIASNESKAEILDSQTFQKIGAIDCSSGAVEKVQFSGDDNILLCCSSQSEITIWDTATSKVLKHLGESKSRGGRFYDTRKGGYTRDCKYIISCDQTQIWDAQSFQEIPPFTDEYFDLYEKYIRGQEYYIREYSNDKMYYAMKPGHEVIILKLKNEFEEVDRLKHRSLVNNVMFSSDGEYVVTASADKTAKIWKRKQNSDSFQCVGTMTHLAPVVDAQFSPDGNCIVTATITGEAYVWERIENSEEFEKVHSLFEYSYSSPLSTAQFSQSGKVIAVVAVDNSVHLFDGIPPYAPIETIHPFPGMKVSGVDLRNISEKSELSNEVKEYLIDHGAEIL